MAKGRMASMFAVGDDVMFGHSDKGQVLGTITKIYPDSGQTGHAKVKSPGLRTVTRKLQMLSKVKVKVQNKKKGMSNARFNAIAFSGNARLKRDNGIC